jgi:predicted transcriptional regulator
METVIEQLQDLGFGQYEAQAYVGLLKHNPVNGYELAKNSSIPRPNIYKVLHKLEERGAVLRFDTPEGIRYSPVNPEELILKMHSCYQSTLENAKQSLKKVTTPFDHEHVWNAQGYPVLIEHAQSMITSASSHVLIANYPQEMKLLSESLEIAQKNRVQIRILCLAGCSHQCTHCRGQVFRYQLSPHQSTRWLMVIPDSQEVLAGQIGSSGDASLIRTRQKLLIDLSIQYIHQSIALASMLSDLGRNFKDHFSPETRQTLYDISSSQDGVDWIAQMLRLNAGTIRG